MKKVNFVLIAIFLLASSFGCQNSTDPNIEEEIKNVSVSSSEVFEFKTGVSGDEEVVTIEEQPKNYEVSTIVRDSTTNWEAVYQYQSESGFQGSDYAEIKIGTGSDGASPNENITLIKLNITVN
ncbi:hypothetical protein [Fodinibius saliphilus]|uniref:hypothetical protein n=1 Tax=Fodinibius saliphilus TaxID=1920650 RepID=UPI0011090913|nr:hypothetical protein [Fodinibius saliphilus]